MQVRNWLYVEDFCRGDRHRARARRGRRGLQRRRPRRAARTSRSCRRILELTGRDESLIELRRPTASATTAATRSSSDEDRGARLGGRRSRFAEGLERTVALVPRQRGWWEPIRSGEYREYYERQYGTSARLMPRAARDAARRARRCSSPTVHGDERGFLVETFRADAWARARRRRRVRPGQPLALARAGTLRGLHFQTDARPGEAGPLPARARSSTSPSTCAATRPPTGSGRATSSTTRRHRQLFVPVGFAHGFCVLSEVADVAYKLLELLRPRDRGRDRLGRPRGRRRVAGRRAAALRARPQRAAPRRDRRRASRANRGLAPRRA